MKTLYLDYSKCIGCGTCEAVCKFIYQVPRIVMTRTAYGLHVPLYCQHCDNPKCMRVCKAGAIYKDQQGIVRLDEKKCTGCQSKNCLVACPYVAMMCTGQKYPVTKCDLCATRGNLGPACAAMCPCDALVLVRREEIPGLNTRASQEAYERVRKFVICPDCPPPTD